MFVSLSLSLRVSSHRYFCTYSTLERALSVPCRMGVYYCMYVIIDRRGVRCNHTSSTVHNEWYELHGWARRVACPWYCMDGYLTFLRCLRPGQRSRSIPLVGHCPRRWGRNWSDHYVWWLTAHTRGCIKRGRITKAGVSIVRREWNVAVGNDEYIHSLSLSLIIITSRIRRRWCNSRTQ